MEEWLALTGESGRKKHGELVSWLKSEHGITHGYANLIAHYTLKSDAGSMMAEGEDLVAAMFAGDKATMRPIFDALVARISSMGADIEEAPKKGYLSLRQENAVRDAASVDQDPIRCWSEAERRRPCRSPRSRGIVECDDDAPRASGARRGRGRRVGGVDSAGVRRRVVHVSVR
jgi:hypothetical protein